MTIIVAEIGNIHEGSIGIAKSLVDSAKNAGADVVKFQMHKWEFESTPTEPFRVKFSDQDASRVEYWQRVNFTNSGWKSIKQYCDQIGIEFMCTPFSVEAAQFLEEDLDVSSWKIGSGDALNWPLLEYVLNTGKMVNISTGLISMKELENLISWIKSLGFSNFRVLHCVSQYPTPLDAIGIGILEQIKSLHSRVGYSDHSGNLNVAKFALSYSFLEILEIHITPRRDFFGPDVASSLTPEEISELVKFRDVITVLRDSKVTKEQQFIEVENSRKIFRKGLYAKIDLDQGTTLSISNLSLRKPVAEIDSVDLGKVIGMKLKKYVKAGASIQWSDLE